MNNKFYKIIYRLYIKLQKNPYHIDVELYKVSVYDGKDDECVD